MSLGVTRERYNILTSKYQDFIKNLDKMDAQPIRVFDQLTKKQIDELELIRDVSKYLQNKKDADIKSQTAPAEPAEAEKEKEVKEEEEKEKKEN